MTLRSFYVPGLQRHLKPTTGHEVTVIICPQELLSHTHSLFPLSVARSSKGTCCTVTCPWSYGRCVQAPMQFPLLGPNSHVPVQLQKACVQAPMQFCPRTTQSRVCGVRRGACVQAPMQFSLLGIELIVCSVCGNLLILAVHTCTCAVPDTQQVSGGPHITVLAACFCLWELLHARETTVSCVIT